jgi:putative phosphoesterase
MLKDSKQQEAFMIGLISDTHGLLRPDVVQAFRGAHMIIHAGDIGKPEVLSPLKAMAPVIAVRGNVDRGIWTENLNTTEVVECGGILLYVVHDLHGLDLDPAEAGFKGVISGHSHYPTVNKKHGVLYVNPGSAGPRRFTLPITVALLRIQGHSLDTQILQI